ncbi:MAG: pyruvate kinase [Saprospiraceae bacterium]|jgi:pyruvate kinase
MRENGKLIKNSKKGEKIKAIIVNLDSIIEKALSLEADNKTALGKIHPAYQSSARNLLHYRALRSHKLNDLQKELGNLGLSRLARIQSHVLSSLYTIRGVLASFLGKEIKYIRSGVSLKKGNRILKKNAKTLLGYRSKGRRTRIMVTLPSEAAEDYEMVKKMIAAGMNCARINCAHDDAAAWAKMISNVRKASKKLKKNCKIAMDLAGPKIRTGSLVPGPKVRKFRPEKDNRGKTVQALKVLIATEPPETGELLHIPVSEEDLKKIKIGNCLYFRDARNKKRKLEIIADHDQGFLASCIKTTYLETGTRLYFKKDEQQEFLSVGELPNVEIPILIKQSDILRIDRKNIPGESATYDKEGKMIDTAHVSCTAPEVFEDVKVADPIFFDDGKISGIIKSVNKDFAAIEITNAAKDGSKLRSDKGINFPSSELTISGLTQKDKTDLEFVAKNTDVINLSFVNSPDDVRQLLKELKNLDPEKKCGIILKIETQRGYNQLIEILLKAMQVYPVGVMIARGDLAVESGWKNIGRVQEEILSICQAAHVTDIWATQVLDNLAKSGVPSRAEMTDVVKAQQADCIMLNKGPHIFDSINLLHAILKDMEPYREKNISFLPRLSKADSL